MNLDDDDDSVFEQALRADLPSVSEQNRLRQRILVAGIAAGTALGSANVAAAGQASLGVSALSKLSALSWPAKLALATVVAAPALGATLPLVYAPVRAADLVSQVRRSAATVHAQTGTKAALTRAHLQPLEAPPSVPPQPEPRPAQGQLKIAVRAPVLAAGNLQAPAAPSASSLVNDNAATASASSRVNGNAAAAPPAVAAFDSVAHDPPANGSEGPRNESTLAAETQLLDRAFAALAAGDQRSAAVLVAEHARRFPNGLLRQERERARARLAADPKGE